MISSNGFFLRLVNFETNQTSQIQIMKSTSLSKKCARYKDLYLLKDVLIKTIAAFNFVQNRARTVWAVRFKELNQNMILISMATYLIILNFAN